jgi:hypothetical protein
MVKRDFNGEQLELCLSECVIPIRLILASVITLRFGSVKPFALRQVIIQNGQIVFPLANPSEADEKSQPSRPQSSSGGFAAVTCLNRCYLFLH